MFELNLEMNECTFKQTDFTALILKLQSKQCLQFANVYYSNDTYWQVL